MNHLERLKQRLRGKRTLFREPAHAGDMGAILHNEWSLIIFAEYLASRRTREGRRLAVDTVAEYVSMAKVELSVSYGFAIAGEPQRLPHIIKAMRRQRPRKQRRERRGLRGRHLRAAWRAAARRWSQDGDAAATYAAVASAWQTLARGGEVATPAKERRQWRPSARPTRADLTFHRSRHGRYACLMLRPIKRRNGEIGDKVPILIAEGDGGGDDTYAALQRMEALQPCHGAARSRTPLFARGGKPLTVEQLRLAARRVWRQAGQSGKVGAHSMRIGGATDLADRGASQALIQAKGRWASDIFQIYARMTRRAQLAASRSMQQRASGADMEELFPGFTQGR
jgi:hypothetical protein